MDRLEIGQEWEFVEPVNVDRRAIEKGTRVRVGFIEEEVLETKVMVVVLGTEPPQTLTIPRRVLTLHATRLRKAG
jgi:hypothetical protein